MKFINTSGAPVAGPDRFFNRETETKHLCQQIEAGSHLLLVAPRRVGKTSLLREIQRLYSGTRIVPYVDLEASSSPAQAIQEFADALSQQSDKPNTVSKWLRETLGIHTDAEVSFGDFRLALNQSITDDNWKLKADTLFNGLHDRLEATNSHAIIFIDELSVLVMNMINVSASRSDQGISESQQFLSWLRSLRQRINSKRISFIITGSIGLEDLLRTEGLTGFINDIEQFEVKPWPIDTALALLTKLSTSYTFQLENNGKLMCSLLGACVPHHVQVYFSQLKQHCSRNNRDEATETDMKKVFYEDLLSVNDKCNLQPMYERLHKYLSADDFSSVNAVLGYLSNLQQDQGATAKTLKDHLLSIEEGGTPYVGDDKLRTLLRMLQHDGYLINEANQYRFMSNLLKEWWKKEYAPI